MTNGCNTNWCICGQQDVSTKVNTVDRVFLKSDYIIEVLSPITVDRIVIQIAGAHHDLGSNWHRSMVVA